MTGRSARRIAALLGGGLLLVSCTAIFGPLVAGAPSFNVTPGSYPTAQSVSLSDGWANTTIYYTTDGSTPTTTSAAYSSPISVGASGATETTISAMAVKPGVSSSAVATGTYWISGTITTIAGTGVAGYTGDAGQATAAEFSAPASLAIDANGNIYISDNKNNVVRKIAPSGIITTVAGGGASNPGNGGPATSAVLSDPMGIGLDPSGNLYIVEGGGNCVRKVNTSGTISLFAGTGVSAYFGDGGPATSAGLKGPWAVAADSAGNVYIDDVGAYVVRKVDTSGTITTFAGNGTFGDSGDNGPATAASLGYPTSVATDPAGNVFIADEFGGPGVRRVDTTGTITTIAGSTSAGGGFSGDLGPATSAGLFNPTGVAADSKGDVYIMDVGNNRIRKVDPAGIINTVAGNGTFGSSGDNGPATQAEVNLAAPSGTPFSGIAVDSAGNLYIAEAASNVVRKVH